MLGKKPTTRAAFVLLALLAFGPGLLSAGENASEATAPTASTGETASETLAVAGTSGALGMIVVIDQETGKLRAPTTYERDAMSSQYEEYWLDGSDLETTKGPGNSVILKLDSRFHKYAVAEAPKVGQAKVQHDVLLVETEALQTETLQTGPAEAAKDEAVDEEEPAEAAEEVTP